jgi:hypothetical protein
MGEPVTVERSSEVGKGPLGRSSAQASTPLRNAGGFFAFSLDVLVTLFKPPFAWREFLDSVGLTGVGRERHSTADLRATDHAVSVDPSRPRYVHLFRRDAARTHGMCGSHAARTALTQLHR